jgi:hypothetical protein
MNRAATSHWPPPYFRPTASRGGRDESRRYIAPATGVLPTHGIAGRARGRGAIYCAPTYDVGPLGEKTVHLYSATLHGLHPAIPSGHATKPLPMSSRGGPDESRRYVAVTTAVPEAGAQFIARPPMWSGPWARKPHTSLGRALPHTAEPNAPVSVRSPGPRGSPGTGQARRSRARG